MISKWYELKEEAITLRKKGISIGSIEQQLGIPRSTLSGWFQNIQLTHNQKKRLRQQWENGLVKARRSAITWHNAEKAKRLSEAQNQALETLKGIDAHDQRILEIALALLYLGEGSKTLETSMGSSDPLILKFFLICLKKIYHMDPVKIRCELHLRADQDPKKAVRFWSKELKLPISNFKYISVDQRTTGSKTYSHYQGVCQIRCGTVAIQRKLINLANIFCKRAIIEK